MVAVVVVLRRPLLRLIQLHRIHLYECARTMNYSALGKEELNSNINSVIWKDLPNKVSILDGDAVAENGIMPSRPGNVQSSMQLNISYKDSFIEHRIIMVISGQRRVSIIIQCNHLEQL